MIFPNKHKEDIRELTKKEWMDLYELQKLSINVIDKLYNPTGYNFGFNLGKDGGASIPHIHFHIVPRYKNEVGIIELFSDARIIVENPIETQKKLKKEFKKLNLKI
jgi:ATP adenylyltransferase